MAPALASIDLVLLCVLTLSLALLDSPVPRAWALAGGALVIVQTAAMQAMDLQPYEPGAPASGAIVHSVAEAVAVLAVPALTAVLLTVIFFHLARAYAHARRRLEAALADQAIGSDMPTG